MKSEVAIAAEIIYWLDEMDEEGEASLVNLLDEVVARNNDDWMKFLMNDGGLISRYIDEKY